MVPGVTVHHLGGHTADLQVMRVPTARGHVVLAADASHFYGNVERDRPYSIMHELPAMYDAFDRLGELADAPGLVVPGHDPRVLDRFPAVPGLEGLAVRIAGPDRRTGTYTVAYVLPSGRKDGRRGRCVSPVACGHHLR